LCPKAPSLLGYSVRDRHPSLVGHKMLERLGDEFDIQQTNYSDGGAHEVNHNAEHVTSHLSWYWARPGAVHGRRYGLWSALILSAIAVLFEVGESALQKTTYSDGGARRKEFDANPLHRCLV